LYMKKMKVKNTEILQRRKDKMMLILRRKIPEVNKDHNPNHLLEMILIMMLRMEEEEFMLIIGISFKSAVTAQLSKQALFGYFNGFNE